MTDREILLTWKGGSPLRIAREERIYLIADRMTGNGGAVRCVRDVALDADNETILLALRDLADDLLIAEVQFPQHLVKLGNLSHGV
ncbi:MAG: hypothetical protein ABR949_10135 [Candidatus Aquilonibacter sp.]|jgi:hypothetical protein